MQKKINLLLIAVLFSQIINAQILYSEKFNTLSLTTGTYIAGGSVKTYLYKDVPTGMFTINNGGLVADTLTGNYPFRAIGQKQKAWLSYKETSQTDTFAVSTSWLNPTGVVDSWIITPTINSIAPNTVLTWKAMAPDAYNLDGYEVYVTTNTLTAPSVGDFSPANKLFSIVAETYSWQTHGVSLAAYAGQNIRIAFRNNTTNKYQLWLDDIVVENISLGFDVATTENNTYKYSSVGINNIISATFKNNGYTPINTLTINYKMGINPTITETKTLTTTLSYLDKQLLNFSVPYITSTPVYNQLKIWVSAINGSADLFNANDTIIGSLTISTTVPAKKVLVEEYTSSSCGWCPDSYLKLKNSIATQTNVIVASLHLKDTMSSLSINQLAFDYNSALPSATIDQYLYSKQNTIAIDQYYWDSTIIKRQLMPVPATVTLTGVSFNTITREINATVSSTFVGDVKGDYRLNLYVKDNYVYGLNTDSLLDNKWNQHSFLYNIPTSPYYQQGNYLNPTTFILGSNRYKHQFVIDTMLSGAYGEAGVIPASVSTIGNTYSKAYTYTLSMPIATEFRYHPDNIYLIGVLSEYNSNPNKRAILNVAEVKLTSSPESPVSLKENTENNFKINVFPNPATSKFTLSYNLKNNETVTTSIYNILGELVYTDIKNETHGFVSNELFVVNLPQGNYNIIVSTPSFKTIKKLTIIK